MASTDTIANAGEPIVRTITIAPSHVVDAADDSAQNAATAMPPERPEPRRRADVSGIEQRMTWLSPAGN